MLRWPVLLFFWDGCRDVAQPGLGPVIVTSWGFWGGPLGPDCLHLYPGPAATTAALMDASGMAAMGSLCWAATMASMFAATFFQPLRAGRRFLGTNTRLLHGVRVGAKGLERQLKLWSLQRVNIESDYELEPPRTIWNRTPDVFDIPAERARRGWNEHELMHYVFEHGVSQGLRMAEFYLGDGHVRSVDRQGDDVFDLPREAAQRGWDEHELMHLVFEHGKEEGMNLAEMHLGDGDDSSVVFQVGCCRSHGCLLSMS